MQVAEHERGGLPEFACRTSRRGRAGHVEGRRQTREENLRRLTTPSPRVPAFSLWPVSRPSHPAATEGLPKRARPGVAAKQINRITADDADTRGSIRTTLQEKGPRLHGSIPPRPLQRTGAQLGPSPIILWVVKARSNAPYGDVTRRCNRSQAGDYPIVFGLRLCLSADAPGKRSR
jgi:hypothetical protein